MQHIITTRLNQKWKQRELDYDYMSYRLDLFEKTAYKSLLNQDVKGFKHIIFTSPSVPDKIRDRTEGYENSSVYYYDRVDGKEILGKSFSKKFCELFSFTEDEIIVTTNLDSDDMLRNDYVRKVNKVAEETLTFPIHVCSCVFYQYNTNNTVDSLYKKNFHPAAFSVIDKFSLTGNNLFSFSRGHNNIYEDCSETINIDSPMLVLCHYFNICTNGFNSMVKEKGIYVDLTDYGVSKETLNSIVHDNISNDIKNRELAIRKEFRRNKGLKRG